MPSPNLAANFLSRAFYDILSFMKNITLTLVAAASLALSISAACGANDRPVLRIGAMSDNHLHADRTNTHVRTKACFDLFRRENVDIVVDTGDIADLSHVSELKAFRRYFDEAFAGTDCVPFFCIANHDYNYLPGTKKNDPKNFENASRALGMPGVNPTAVVKGYRFVNVFQNEPDPKAFANAVAKAVAANRGNRPVFVVNHVPPMLTTTGTVHWSSQAVRDVLNRYPQVVALTGHIHTAISWAANVWQGEFTAVNLGAHAEYSNKIDGEATVLSVYADRIDIRRYEAVSGREIGADDRWSIPLPLDPKHGPYRPEVRAQTCPVPALPADAAVRYEQDPSGQGGTLVFSSAAPRGKAKHYRITLESQQADGAWKFLGTLNWSAPQVLEEPASWECELSPAMLDGGRPHRATIVPVSSFDVAGKGRTFPFDVPASPLKALPAELTRIVRYQRSNAPGKDVFAPSADGWFEKDKGNVVAVLPKELNGALQKAKAAILRVDVASEQSARPNTFSLGKFEAAGGNVVFGVGGRFYTLPGNYAAHRYVWTIARGGKRPKPGDEICLVIREGDRGRFRINEITCFLVP